MICSHICMSVCKYAYACVHDHVSVCGVLISSGSIFSKTAVTVIQAFSYDFSTEIDVVWELFDLPLTPRAI